MYMRPLAAEAFSAVRTAYFIQGSLVSREEALTEYSCCKCHTINRGLKIMKTLLFVYIKI